ncbi:MAG: DnaJ domain-containing protein [Deltaproteobacteria bacterium]|nr:DnaJ domain-containing protein [Deltaproteobacteria bacterium]
MEWDLSARVIVEPSIRVDTLPLSPTEFFLWTRIQGPISVGGLLRGAGMPADQAQAGLARLLELGAARLEAPPPRARPTPTTLAERRRLTLVAQLGAARAAPVPGADAPRGGAPTTSAGASSSSSSSSSSAPDELAPPPWPRVGPDDLRLQNDHALPIEEQRRVLALVDRLEDLSPYEILGLWPTHDMKAIKRAYHEVSREFHPDSYYGHQLGDFREHLSTLFHRATAAYQALDDLEVRDPYVDAEIARRAELRRRAHLQDEAKRQQAALREAQAEAEAAARRHERAVLRAHRQRDALDVRVQLQLEQHMAEAAEAERQGNLARAANSWRLALQLKPGDAVLEGHWVRCRDVARSKRAAEAFARAMTMREVGQGADAVGLLVEAAEAHGTLEHLAHAAEAIAPKDPGLARKFALGALEVLRAEQSAGATSRRPPELARLHILLARAFQGAGQIHTAKEQAQVANKLRPNDPEIRALLNSLKLP